jgi:hypothetical protein
VAVIDKELKNGQSDIWEGISMRKILRLRERILAGIILALSFLRVSSSNALSDGATSQSSSTSSTALAIGPSTNSQTTVSNGVNQPVLLYKAVVPDYRCEPTVCGSCSCSSCGGCDCSCSCDCSSSCTC